MAMTSVHADPGTTRRDTDAASLLGAKATTRTVRHRVVDALPCFGLTGVVRTFIAVAARLRLESTHSIIDVIARVVCAEVVVIAYHALTRVISPADCGYAYTRNAR